MTFYLRRQLHSFRGDHFGLLSSKNDQVMQMTEFKSCLRLEAEEVYQTRVICRDDTNADLDDIWRFDDFP